MAAIGFVVALVGLLALGLPVAVVVTAVALIVGWLWAPFPITDVFGIVAWEQGQHSILVAIPLFVLLGELMLSSGIAARMYGAILPWLTWLPGQLMYTNIAASTMFAATTGSSLATAATIGRISEPEIQKHGYNERLFLGSIAAGGTLGILIPPSVSMIVYGYLTSTSVPQIFLAGFIPGMMLALAFMITILVSCLIVPAWGGRRVMASWNERLSGIPHLVPPLILFLLVIGTIYAGLATPTEAASLGVVGALVLAASTRTLTFEILHGALRRTIATTAILLAIIIFSFFLNFAIAAVGFVDAIVQVVRAWDISPTSTIALMVLFLLALGCVLDGASMVVLTVPVLTPVAVALGYDKVWFAIIVVLCVEMGLITPPIGMNCFVVQGIRKGGPIRDVFIGITPFLGSLLVVTALVIAFPQLALWLPTLFFR